MLTRRNFLRLTGTSTLSLFYTDRLGVTRQLFARIPDTLDPATVPKFATSMLIPPVMPRAGTIRLAGGKNGDYYEISMKQFTQQILPEGLPGTTVWGYGAVAYSITVKMNCDAYTVELSRQIVMRANA